MAAVVSQLPPKMEAGTNGQQTPQITLPTTFKEEPKSLPSVKTENGSAENYGFQMLDGCTYTPKYLGSSDQEALGCDCSEEHGKRDIYHKNVS